MWRERIMLHKFIGFAKHLTSSHSIKLYNVLVWRKNLYIIVPRWSYFSLLSAYQYCTLDTPVTGKRSNDSSASSPGLPCSCPLKILDGVTVDSPIPSPRNKITFLATFTLGLRDRMLLMTSCPSCSQSGSSTENVWYLHKVFVRYKDNESCN